MIKHLHVVRKARPGKDPLWYIYAWRGGPPIHRHEGKQKPRLSDAQLRELVAAQQAKVRRVPAEDTIRDLIACWQASPEWKKLADTTRKTWQSQVKLIEAKWGAIPLSVWSDPRITSKVVAWRDSRAETPRAADNGIVVLRALLKFAKLRGKVAINAAEGIPQLYHSSNRAEIVWSSEDMLAFEASAKALGKPHIVDGLWLAALTGLRREDLVTLNWDEVGENAIVKKAAKTSRRKRRYATVPRIAELDQLLESLRGRLRATAVNTVLVNSYGKPWTGDGFGGSFNEVRDHADIAYIDPETGERRPKHIHDLRGTYCTKLILAGLSNQEVADIMAWSPEQIAGIRRTYVDQGRVNVAIAERLRGRL